jgi:hypothetical protein
VNRDDGPAFPGGGYTDRDGLWRTDHRTVREVRRDSAVFLLTLFGAPWLVLGVVLAVASWLT